MDPVPAPALPIAGRAIDLEGWAQHALGNALGRGDGVRDRAGAGARPFQRADDAHPTSGLADRVARVLWRTAWAAAAREVDRPHAARAWFDDLAQGRVVLPGHLLVLEDGELPPPPTPGVERVLDPPGGGDAPDDGALVRALEGLAQRPGERLVLSDRARWVHPALRAGAPGVSDVPFVRAWLNLAAFAVPGPRAAFEAAGEARASGAVDWVELRGAVVRAVRLLDGLLDVHADAAPARVPRVDREWRRIALGLAGLCDALDALGVPQDGPGAALQARRMALSVVENAHRASVELGFERGAFPRYGDSLWARRGRPRRHGLCTLSWSSDGLLEACGVSEGAAPSSERPVPSVFEQLQLQVECQRAFEGLFLVTLAVDGAGAPSDGAPFDLTAVARAVRELDVQCLAVDDRRLARRPVAEPADDELVPSPTRPRAHARRAADGPATFSIAPALRLAAETEHGRWRLDVVYDDDGEREVELVLVAAPAGCDGWRLVDRLNGELGRGAALLEALPRCLASAEPAGDGVRELGRVLLAFAERGRGRAGGGPRDEDRWAGTYRG